MSENESPYKILPTINSPNDLKLLNKQELLLLCDELRLFIIHAVAENPGHLGASLGVIELTVAIHAIFNTPYDKLIWDVGHQAYAHKILTGRRDIFVTNRKYKGISGFPKMKESVYDAFGVGHSSTSISAALGMAQASIIKNETRRQHIAVIGDGSITAGQALEALNLAGVSKTNILVVLNDNGISIDKSVGGLNQYLTNITTSRIYNKIKDEVWQYLSARKRFGIRIRSLIQRIESSFKMSFIRKINIFEALGFRYFGPIDGHDIERLTKVLNDLKVLPGPKVLHVITKKGKGFKPAEYKQTLYHAPGQFDSETGKILEKKSDCKQAPKYQLVFGRTLVELALLNEKITGVTPAMASGCSMDIMMRKLPGRAFDVGITEQHAVTFSAGLASQGLIPFCNIYSTFMQRAYDQVIHDVALQKLPVIFCLDRAGLVGEDGPTHHGSFDLAYFRCIPDITIFAPLNEIELRNIMYTAQLLADRTFVIRYPRGKGVTIDWEVPFEEIPIGKGNQLVKGNNCAIISIGHVGNFALDAIKTLAEKSITPSLYNIRFLKPIDTDLLHDACKTHAIIITVEDGTIVGGLGTAVAEFITENRYNVKLVKLGIPDHFIEHGSLQELHQECGYSAEAIENAVIENI